MEIGAKITDLLSSATDIFGSPAPDAVFAAAQNGTDIQQAAQLTVAAQKREINRIRGYKVQLTPAENARLQKIQEQIQKIEKKANDGGILRADELEERKDLYAEADRIIGKPSVDVEADQTLANLAATLNQLLAKKLSPRERKQVESLERIEAGLRDRLADNPTSATIQRQIVNLAQRIEKLAPLRSVPELSRQERKAYDEITGLINEHAGAKIQLPSKDALRVAELEESILNLQASLPPDASQQPTSGQVARAYTRLG